MKPEKIVLITGGFDPIHRGHIEYIKAAASLGDILVVGLNSDDWLSRKKGKPFMEWRDRQSVVESIRQVEMVISFDDTDGSAKDAIRRVRDMYPLCQIIFANGGDRNSANIPEMDVGDTRITFVFGVGGDDKKNSSSWILNNWSNNKKENP
jgi:D-beta-D-heptose 7-phosphate kinase/D-beta-D-heptose 1-phosphate adenosyltransferase